MEQYISKDAVVAEIGRRIKKYATIDVGNSSELDALYGAKCHALKSILTFLDTLEVKEVDFEREFDNYIEDQNAFINNDNSEIKYYLTTLMIFILLLNISLNLVIKHRKEE